MSDRLCLCNHLESAHRLTTDDIVRCAECSCTVFEWDPIEFPETRHSQHTTPVVGCDRCDDALDEAREIQSERPWEDA